MESYKGVHFIHINFLIIIISLSHLQDLYDRECERMASGLARTVPRLRETHVLRDSWTKLNVAPAKIMQVKILVSHHN